MNKIPTAQEAVAISQINFENKKNTVITIMEDWFSSALYKTTYNSVYGNVYNILLVRYLDPATIVGLETFFNELEYLGYKVDRSTIFLNEDLSKGDFEIKWVQT